jgi:hypothetical protein
MLESFIERGSMEPLKIPSENHWLKTQAFKTSRRWQLLYHQLKKQANGLSLWEFEKTSHRDYVSLPGEALTKRVEFVQHWRQQHRQATDKE